MRKRKRQPMPSELPKRRKGKQGNKRYSSYWLRVKVYERDAGQCQYCGEEVTFAECNIDHIYPYHLGGPTQWHNLVVACRGCNDLKRGQVIPDGLGPRDNATDRIADRMYLAGKEYERHRASQDMKDSIRIIREARAMGIDLSDIYTDGMIERWAG